jgi:predicted  nucleic acid-binding Zn-ribbon protein
MQLKQVYLQDENHKFHSTLSELQNINTKLRNKLSSANEEIENTENKFKL